MASITEILGTDSLASSRIVLNDNFASINDQVLDIAALLDVSTQNLTLTGNVNAKELSLVNGGASSFKVNTSDIVASLPVTVEDSLILEGGLKHSVAPAQVMPAANDYTKSTYVLDGALLNTPQVVNAGDEGQTVTFIAAGNVTIDNTDIAGVAANIIIANNGTLTLRFYNSSWYVVSHANATVTY